MKLCKWLVMLRESDLNGLHYLLIISNYAGLYMAQHVPALIQCLGGITYANCQKISHAPPT